MMKDLTENVLSLYIRDIQQIPLLSLEEEKRLIKMAKRGNREAFWRLILSNLRFVMKIAFLYRGRGVPLLDIISEGNIGLMKALQHFRPSEDVRFLTYAIFWIKQRIDLIFSQQKQILKFPSSMPFNTTQVKNIQSKLESKEGQEPSIKEIATALDISENRVRFALEFASSSLSLDADLTGVEGVTLGDILSREDKTLFYMEIEESLAVLSKKEQKIVSLYFGLKNGRPHTLSEVGKEMGFSHERVRQIKNKAVETLKKEWEE